MINAIKRILGLNVEYVSFNKFRSEDKFIESFN